jgi:hypothetical protein
MNDVLKYLEPDWTDFDKVHNWKNYISEELVDMWDSFTDNQKIAIGENAQGLADNEEWD